MVDYLNVHKTALKQSHPTKEKKKDKKRKESHHINPNNNNKPEKQ
jgi:hypothetical protein